ncbi:hypothetical protein [Catellatospora vulcania]|uniref:hypothetical protein n=1 Tax=Catellatospora vulcania TaxID=1460450 RepID=UPI0012D396FE|nr:hypothetical protein [Catellatospora vulcania]
MPMPEPGTAWRDLPDALRAQALRAGRAGAVPADPAVQDAMVVRHHAWLRRSRWLTWTVVALLPLVWPGTFRTTGFRSAAESRAALAGIAVVALAAAVMFGVEVAGSRWARLVAPARVAAALRNPRGAVPTAVRQPGLGSPIIALLVFGVPVTYLSLVVSSIRFEQDMQAEMFPGEPLDWGAVGGWAIVWAFTILVPASIGLVHAYRLKPFDRGPAVRVDESGIWIRRLRATVPWTEVTGLHTVGPSRRDGVGLAVQVRDPDRIVARSAYPRPLRRYLLWGLRSGNRWIVVDERLLREPADELLAAALAYQATHPPAAEFAVQGDWGWW